MSSPNPTEIWLPGDLCTVFGEGSEVFTVTDDIGERTAMLVNAAGQLHGREGFQKMRRHPQNGELWRPREGVEELPPSYTLWRERIVGLITQFPEGGAKVTQVGITTVAMLAGAATITASLTDMRFYWERVAAKEHAQ